MMQQQQQTTVVIAQPQQQNQLLLVPIHGHREWTSGLFDCGNDVNNALYTCCCYCCAVTSLAVKIGESACTTSCVPAADIGIRTRIRTIGGIRGTMCKDCLIIAACGPCAACQEYRELREMGL